MSKLKLNITEQAKADITLITKQLGCEAINEDLIDEINDIHQEDVNEFKTLLQSFQPVLDESISFNNNTVIIMLKSGTKILYIIKDSRKHYQQQVE